MKLYSVYLEKKRKYDILKDITSHKLKSNESLAYVSVFENDSNIINIVKTNIRDLPDYNQIDRIGVFDDHLLCSRKSHTGKFSSTRYYINSKYGIDIHNYERACCDNFRITESNIITGTNLFIHQNVISNNSDMLANKIIDMEFADTRILFITYSILVAICMGFVIVNL
jgi:hypothetical protein